MPTADITKADAEARSSTEPYHTMNVFRIRPAIVLFGDSITQQGFGVDGHVGWASLLAARYTRRADVFNRGFSGYNTNHAIDLLPNLFGPLEQVLFCTVFFGANDAALEGESQYVNIEQYAANLETIVTSIRKTIPADFPIILITPPPVDEAAWIEFRQLEKSNRDNVNTRSYGEQVKQIAAKLNCHVVDAWELLDGATEERGKYLSDGLHLNEEGNRRLYDGLMQLLEKEYPHLAPMEDGDGKYGTCGIPLEEKLWTEMC
jgi:lysophospholipase L1-like esterase